MAEEGKKISFGFVKSIKKPVLRSTVPQEEKKVDYIECLDEKGIKVIGEEEKKDEPLVIPLLGSKTWHDRIINKIDADIFEPKTKEEPTDDNAKQEGKVDVPNGSVLPQISVKEEVIENDENKAVTLEEQAAKEIIEDLNSKEKEEQSETKTLTLSLTDDPSLRGTEQSTLEDYDKIPVDAFGLAMLRGMGWQPGKGIGKNEKVVSAVIPELRPKGMGLGADKVALQKNNTDSKKQEEELKIEKGTFVKIIAGKQSNNYGQIEGFDEDAGRLIIKLALGGNIISVNEFMVQPVTKSEYSKNSKVLNVKKYEEYKDKASTELKHKAVEKKKSASSVSSGGSEDDDKNNVGDKKKEDISCNRNKYDKKSKRRKRISESDSGDDDSDYGKRRRRGRSASSNSDSYESKKSRKSKKHKRNSPERSSKKHKKKDREREKTKDRKSRDFTDKRKHKKRGRSRSRSFSKR
ncbi:G-patch domain and KOW motifs-containing protein [Osmia bicornis bicornis]|uniref:G-patch domain and KOW motifs-containing protein n=1 Tax=Osmia bicornis bicornis TaxID=1437191 RepID=UPI001EAEA9F4|nr:G-patch domain and KOW motifs-containing protein [Osmia bicornis bicornis]